MAAKPPSPFASAKRVSTAAAVTDKGSVYVAAALLDRAGREIFSSDNVRQAVEGYVEGARQLNSAETLMKTHRPVIERFSMDRYTTEWRNRRVRPDTPAITSSHGGATIKYIVQDRSINLTDAEKERIAVIVGANRVIECVSQKEVFTLDPNVLDQTIEVVNKDPKTGKTTKKTDTVMNHMAEALQEKFKDHPDLLAALFTVKPVQQTAKGLIERGLESVSDPARLVEFLQVIKAPVQLKPVGV